MNSFTDLIQRIPSALIATCIALVITYIPGLAILGHITAFKRIDYPSRLVIAPGISIALYTLLFTFCYSLGIKLGSGTPWAITFISLALIAINARPSKSQMDIFIRYGLKGKWLRRQSLPHICLVICFLLILTTQLYVVRDLVAPTGSDSVHHTLIVQLLLQNGGLFQSWMPYVDSNSFTYHFGFHAITAMYAWMRGSSPEFAVIIMGQVLTVAAVMALYALVRPWVTTAWGAVFVVIISAFFSAYPGGFVNYGRYTQLAGQIILIAALVLLNAFLTQRPTRENLAFYPVLSLTIAGLGLAQYQEAIIFAVLATMLVAYHFLNRLMQQERWEHALLSSVGRAFTIAAVALVLFLPRGLQAVSPGSTSSVRLSHLTDEPTPELSQGYNAIPNLLKLFQTGFEDQNTWVWVLAIGGIALASIKRRQALWLFIGYVMCILIMNPQYIGVHRAGVIDPTHLGLSNYIFIASFAGLAVGTILDILIIKSAPFAWLSFVVLTGLTIAGLLSYPSISQGSELVYPQDLSLMDCIRQQVPIGERIAVRGTFYYDSTVLMGDDAGWWIPFYSERQINLLPLEASGVDIQERKKYSAFFRELLNRDVSTVASAKWLSENGYHFFYIGAKSPSLISSQEKILTQQLLDNPAIQTVCKAGDGRLLSIGENAKHQ